MKKKKVVHIMERTFTRRIRFRKRPKADYILPSMAPIWPPPLMACSSKSITSSVSFAPSMIDITPVTVLAPAESGEMTSRPNEPKAQPILRRKRTTQWARKNDQSKDGWSYVAIETSTQRISYLPDLKRKPSTMDKLKAGLKRRAGLVANSQNDMDSAKGLMRTKSIKERFWPKRTTINTTSDASAVNAPSDSIRLFNDPIVDDIAEQLINWKGIGNCEGPLIFPSWRYSDNESSSDYDTSLDPDSLIEQSLKYAVETLESLSPHAGNGDKLSTKTLENRASIEPNLVDVTSNKFFGLTVERVDTRETSTTHTSGFSGNGDDTQVTDIAETCGNADSIHFKEVKGDVSSSSQVRRLGSPIHFLQEYEADVNKDEVAEANKVRSLAHSLHSSSFITTNSRGSTSVPTYSNCTELTPPSVATQTSSSELASFVASSPFALHFSAKSLLKFIYHHETIRMAMLAEQKSPSNQFWSILHCFVKDGETLYQVLEQLNNDIPLLQITAFLNSKQSYNECLFSDSQDYLVELPSKSYDEETLASARSTLTWRRQSEGWKLQHERYKNDGDGWFYSCLLEEVRQLLVHETISIQPSLDEDVSVSKLACWHSVLVSNLRLHDAQLWRYDAEKIWTIAVIYRTVANRSSICESKKQELELTCLNHNLPDASFLLSYDEFIAKLHSILASDS
ncbi:hypothetical protein TRVA0_009S00716 [Trichomonascus vanleenenianus]|uniref:uncharacterized protein n=1 Tax=Trichomonascus vanleenenianus TaxID=2268995 RepID=UPI003ECB0153